VRFLNQSEKRKTVDLASVKIQHSRKTSFYWQFRKPCRFAGYGTGFAPFIFKDVIEVWVGSLNR
jgi:hypothetical protein